MRPTNNTVTQTQPPAQQTQMLRNVSKRLRNSKETHILKQIKPLYSLLSEIHYLIDHAIYGHYVHYSVVCFVTLTNLIGIGGVIR